MNIEEMVRPEEIQVIEQEIQKIGVVNAEGVRV